VLAIVGLSAKGIPAFSYAVRPGVARIEMKDQNNIAHQITVAHVTTPADGWLVAQADWGSGVPDMILGTAWVPKGESTDVKIDLDSKVPLPKGVFVTLLADGGIPHLLEYSVPFQPGAKRPPGMTQVVDTGGPGSEVTTKDRPIIAGGHVVMAHAAIAQVFAVGPGQASISDTTRTADATAVVIPRVVAPGQSWVSVSLASSGGQIGKVLGFVHVSAGRHTNIVVPIGASVALSQLIVSLHVDLGMQGEFDYSPTDLANSPDQPYVAGGKTVSVPIRIVH
jgi:hypothetical protein